VAVERGSAAPFHSPAGDIKGSDVLALTQGDPAGIGPDITLSAWLLRNEHQLPAFCYLGAAEILQERARLLALDIPVRQIASFDEAASLFAAALPVLPIEQAGEPRVMPGKADPALAAGTIAAITRAVETTLTGEAAAIVTNPISKSVLRQAGFAFPGHTEFLAHLATEKGYPVLRPVMLMAAPQLRVVPVTIHVPLSAVPSLITADLVLSTAEIAIEGLRTSFGIAHPRVAFCGLNPHAGENGEMGHEEIEVIAPAISVLAGRGFDVSGPYPADTLFHEEARQQFDLILAMYHDQGLIPFKTLAFHDGVNVTLGLPFVRTSPDHGTAYGLAGTGRASPESLIQALKLAADMVCARRVHQHG
jgi:4-hydroxythreonine-4-phosphate dehydrogenase